MLLTNRFGAAFAGVFFTCAIRLFVYGKLLMVALPWILGTRGYFLAKKQLSQLGADGVIIAVLSRQSVYTMIVAYMMLSFFLSVPGRT
jgi:hypothetical protein